MNLWSLFGLEFQSSLFVNIIFSEENLGLPADDDDDSLEIPRCVEFVEKQGCPVFHLAREIFD